MHTLGDKTLTTFYKRDTHAIHKEFIVATGVASEKGMPMKLTATGKVTPLLATDVFEAQCIGYALLKKGAGEVTTVQLRTRAIIYGLSAGALTPGPVEFDANVAATTRLPEQTVNQFKTNAGDNKQIGWSLDVATDAGQEIRVVLK